VNRIILRAIGWVLVAIAVLALAVLVRPPDADPSARISVLAYPVTVEHPLRFAMTGDERRLKLITWLVYEPWASFPDVRDTVPFQVQAQVRDASGDVVWAEPTWARGRRSIEERLDGTLRAPTWLPGRPRVAAEDRVQIFNVEEMLAGPGTFEFGVEWLPPGAELYALVFRDGERDAFQERRVRRRASPELLHRVERMGSLRWGDLPSAWRERIGDEVWERMGVLPRLDGTEVTTHRLNTRFVRIPWEDGPAEAIAMAPGGVAVFNTRGAVEISFEWWSIDGNRLEPAASEVRVWRADEELPSSVDVGTSRAGRLGPFSVAGPIDSVQIALDPNTDGPRLLRARTTGLEVDRSYGDPPRRELSEPMPGLTPEQLVAPDFRNLEYYRVAPGLEPVDFPISEDERVMVSVRPRLRWSALPAFRGASSEGTTAIELDLVAADGRVLQTHRIEAESVPSAYERYTEVDHGMTARVCDPTVRYLEPPEGTTIVRARGVDGIVDVELRVRTEPAPPAIVPPPYYLPEDLAFEMTYEPHVRNPWRHRGPFAIDALVRSARLIRMDVQVRPVVREEPEEDTPGPVAARPRAPRSPAPVIPKRPQLLPGAFELIAETDLDGAAAGGRVRLDDEPVGVEVGPAGRMLVDYRVPVEQVGALTVFDIGGREVSVVLPATAGVLRFDGAPQGTPEVRLVDGDGVFLAPATTAADWQVRRVHRLGDGQTLRLPIPGPNEAISVYAYTTSRSTGLKALWSIDDPAGPPSGVFEGSTAWKGALALAPRADRRVLPLSLGGDLWAVEPLYLSIRDDVPAGTATLELRFEPDQEVYVRVLTSWAPAEGDDQRHWPASPPHVVVVP
jgi:hypothetical protein